MRTCDILSLLSRSAKLNQTSARSLNLFATTAAFGWPINSITRVESATGSYEITYCSRYRPQIPSPRSIKLNHLFMTIRSIGVLDPSYSGFSSKSTKPYYFGVNDDIINKSSNKLATQKPISNVLRILRW